MKNPILWVHGDCLSPQNPALLEYPNQPALWVWDDELLAEWNISLKRITFIYECLLELPVIIRRGNVAQEILNFAEEHQADGIVTTESNSPRFEQICDQLEAELDLEIFAIEPFVKYEGWMDLKRFSRYWRVAEKYVYE